MDTPHKTHIALLNTLKDWIGKELGLSQWVTITQEAINTFAQITHDEQWIHIDEERSKKESPYGQTIAHGFFVLSLASHFTYECMSIGDVTMGVNYGLNKVRFPSATPSGAKLRGRISLLDYEEKPNGGRYILKVVFEIERQEKPACVAEFVAQAYTSK